MGRIYAGALGLLAFLTMIARALINQSSPGTSLIFATGVMFVFTLLGWIAGSIAESSVADAVRKQFDSEVAAINEATPNT